MKVSTTRVLMVAVCAGALGLLASLWLAPPDAELFEQFDVAVTQAPQSGGTLEAPWQALVAAVRSNGIERVKSCATKPAKRNSATVGACKSSNRSPRRSPRSNSR